jgi:hypothetical protein
MSEKETPPNPLNRRKHENRWRRILRDADWDQNETVRRWLRFAHKVLEKDKDHHHRDAA